MKGEATEAQQFRLGCGSQQRTPTALGSQTRVDPSAARPRTVAVQDVEPFCALSFGSVATQSVPETSAFFNGPNLNFWRSSHSPQVAAHLPPCSSDSPAPPWPCWTQNTTSHVQFREERKLLLWLLWSLGDTTCKTDTRVWPRRTSNKLQWADVFCKLHTSYVSSIHTSCMAPRLGYDPWPLVHRLRLRMPHELPEPPVADPKSVAAQLPEGEPAES